MASMKTQKKDLYGNPTSSSSSSPDTSFSLDLDEPVLNTNRTTNTKSTSSTSSAYKEKKVVVRATKGQPKDITKSNIWTIIFGQARCSYGQKRGADKRWTTFNGDISISNITNAALTSLIIVVAPVLRKKDLQDKIRDLAVKGAIEKDVNAPKIPPYIDIRSEIESALQSSFTPEFTRQITLIAIRKCILQVIRSNATDKFADKISREFYPKLRRTVNRYGTYSFITIGKVFKSGVYAAVPLYFPQIIFDAACQGTVFLYKFFYREVELNDIDFDDMYAFFCVKMKNFFYMMMRDAIIRTSLLMLDPLLNPAVNEMSFVSLTVAVDLLPMDVVLSKIQEIVNEFKDEKKSKLE